MTQRDKKNVQGACPYCGGWDFTGDTLRRPFQLMQTCDTCGKHHVLNQKTGARYPLDNPDDPKSSPHT